MSPTPDCPTMVDTNKGPEDEPLDVADRKMLAEIKASVLGREVEAQYIGHFRVIERLGEGAMGLVYSAFDDQLQRRVAIKLLHPGVGKTKDELEARMLREAQVLAQLTHPNVVQVHEAGEHEGRVFMAMELVEGRTLHQRQRTGSPDGWKAVLNLYIAAGHGLAAAHAKGVVHRDFKPHNVVVDSEGRARVVDFGLARGTMNLDEQHTAETPVLDEGAIERARVERLTATGAIPGTPAYMAPELFDGQPASTLSDQFSFCVALYEGIYGKRPFEGNQIGEIVDAAKSGRIASAPPGSSAPRWLFKSIARGLAAAPALRHPDMAALLAELERERGRALRLGGILVAFGLVGGSAWWLGATAEPASVPSPSAEATMQERARACSARSAELRSRWREIHDQSADLRIDADDLGVLEVSVRRFIDRWERSCREDLDDSDEVCRANSRLALESMTAAGVHEDIFFNLTYSLELCLEAGPLQCRGSAVDSVALAKLEEGRAAELAGDLGAALVLGKEAAQLAEGHDRLTRSRAKLFQGAIHESRGELDDARELLDGALFDALVCDARVLAIDVTLEQAEVEVLHSGSEASARGATTKAQDLLSTLSSPLPLRKARVFEKQAGALLYLEHRCAESVDLFEQALKIRESAIEEQRSAGHPANARERLAADAQLNIANAKQFALPGGWPTCAIEGIDENQMLDEYRSARKRFAEAVGSETHLGLAEYEQSLGSAHYNLKDWPKALAHFESLLEIYDTHHGHRSMPSAEAHRLLAAVARELDQLDLALTHAKAGVEIWESHRKDAGQRLSLSEAYDVYGIILHESGQLDEAREALFEAIRVLSGPDTEPTLKELEQLHWTHVNLALVEWDRDQRTAAKIALEQAKALAQALRHRDEASPTDLPQQRLLEARLRLEAGNARLALQFLKGAEDLPGMTKPLLPAIIAERERATAMLSQE